MTNATLHNMARSLGWIYVGDRVMIDAGDVIPQIAGVILSQRPTDAKAGVYPTAAHLAEASFIEPTRRWSRAAARRETCAPPSAKKG